MTRLLGAALPLALALSLTASGTAEAHQKPDVALTGTAPEQIAPGETFTIEITASNRGGRGAVRLLDRVPETLLDVTWTCAPLDEAECRPGGGQGNDVDVRAWLPPGGRVVLRVEGVAAHAPEDALIRNTAVLDPPSRRSVTTVTRVRGPIF
ncbi:hypothetical protein [Actinomadura hibisca]|uniref:hypothetical protein n=1 Tax=Actinomadura hibisca TaxID=68565 RepID=UPI00082E3AA0|nr:hypothetical protein [Actinomadura hibisca]